MAGFSTIEIAREGPTLATECLGQTIPNRVDVGAPIRGCVDPRNSGRIDASCWEFAGLPVHSSLVEQDAGLFGRYDGGQV